MGSDPTINRLTVVWAIDCGLQKIMEPKSICKVRLDDTVDHRGHGAFLIQGNTFQQIKLTVGDKGDDAIGARQVAGCFRPSPLWFRI